jgi:hypothetical protein
MIIVFQSQAYKFLPELYRKFDLYFLQGTTPASYLASRKIVAGGVSRERASELKEEKRRVAEGMVL